MNFNLASRDEKGQMYMRFQRIPFTIVDQIQLLQRWILVQSFAYYELNENIASDFKYDENAMQLTELIRSYPDEAARSRYYIYFYDYCGDDETHYTSGFDLLERVRKKDKTMYKRLRMDATNALHLKQMRGVN